MSPACLSLCRLQGEQLNEYGSSTAPWAFSISARQHICHMLLVTLAPYVLVDDLPLPMRSGCLLISRGVNEAMCHTYMSACVNNKKKYSSSHEAHPTVFELVRPSLAVYVTVARGQQEA